MNAKKERELFVRSVEQHLERESRILGQYRALSGLVENTPAAFLIDWVMAEGEAHRNILCATMKGLKEALHEQKGKGSKIDGSGVEDRILFWTEKLLRYEERFAADCLYLKSQACWEGGELFDVLFDAMFMDSKKHQKLLLAVKEMVRK
jgi:hypothetical protein